MSVAFVIFTPMHAHDTQIQTDRETTYGGGRAAAGGADEGADGDFRLAFGLGAGGDDAKIEFRPV